MSPMQTLRVAFRAIMRNKLRSLLTTLGVVIGVGAVIAMVALGEGARSKVEASFASMGANLLIVMPGSTTSGGAQGGFGSAPTLTWDDLKAIPTFSIVVNLDDLFNASTGIYANPGSDGPLWERPCSIELLNPEGEEGFQINCGIRLRGGFSRRSITLTVSTSPWPRPMLATTATEPSGVMSAPYGRKPA